VTEDGMLVRLFNASGDGSPRKLSFSMPLSAVEEVDLNGKLIERKEIRSDDGKTALTLSMPRFGIRTFLLKAR